MNDQYPSQLVEYPLYLNDMSGTHYIKFIPIYDKDKWEHYVRTGDIPDFLKDKCLLMQDRLGTILAVPNNMSVPINLLSYWCSSVSLSIPGKEVTIQYTDICTLNYMSEYYVVFTF